MNLNIENSAEWIGDRIKEIRPYPDEYTGRGIVMVAGGIKYLTNAYASIRLLRDKGCTLPIQCWYLGDSEYNKEMMDIIKKYDVEFINAHQYCANNPEYAQYLGGWECKPFSIIHCPWKEVLYLDADVFVDGDPEYIFDDTRFETAIFFPDYSSMNKNRTYWKAMGIEYIDEKEFESGVIFIDKEKCWNAINLTNKICEYGTKYFFNGDGGDSYGDKDCFRAAWHRTNTQFYMNKYEIKSLQGTMVQSDLNGKLLFYHRNMRKLNIMENMIVSGFANEKELFGYLEDLKKEHNPFVLNSTEKDIKDTNELSGTEWKYIRYGLDERKMIFLKNNLIGLGREKLEHTYCIKDGFLYIISEDGKVTCKLDKFSEGWIGRWSNYEKCLILIVK